MPALGTEADCTAAAACRKPLSSFPVTSRLVTSRPSLCAAYSRRQQFRARRRHLLGIDRDPTAVLHLADLLDVAAARVVEALEIALTRERVDRGILEPSGELGIL